MLGTQTLSGGTASFTATSLTSGNHNITVNYSGDANFTASSATALVSVNAGPLTNFIFSVTGASQQTIATGATATFTFTVSPVSGSFYPSDIKFALTGLPATATATFNPTIVAANAGNQKRDADGKDRSRSVVRWRHISCTGPGLSHASVCDMASEVPWSALLGDPGVSSLGIIPLWMR
jgi:hypothetical protein